VIGGALGGRRLVAPSGRAARPTTDRVREALFAALGERFRDASVLDLYAGSGALAIEALSRGASSAVLVDREAAAIEAARANLLETALDRRARVVRSAVAAFLRRRPPPEAPFGLVLLDPPYDTPASEVGQVLAALATPAWVAPVGAVVLERARAGERPPLPSSWAPAWERAYGDTLVTVLDV
jgi:16S rRNA (guanine966-N2)-methyltransferase